MSPRWLHWPAADGGTDWSDYMSANSGASHVTFASSQTWTTAQSMSGGSNISSIRGSTDSASPYANPVDSNTVTHSSEFYGQLETPYSGSGTSQPSVDYLAAYFKQTTTYRGANANGWVIYKLHDNFTTSDTQAFFYPIEAKSGVTDSTTQYACGSPASWNATSAGTLIIFAFSSYTLGDVLSWTDWDGVTTP